MTTSGRDSTPPDPVGLRPPEGAVRREQVDVDGVPLSCLRCGDPAAEPLLLLHGTFWSRIWQPVLPALGQAFSCTALDLPGFGMSGGELGPEEATVPALADVVERAADALGLETFHLAAHDIGGGIAQHLVATTGRVRRLVLVNAVMLDSWPVPAVERFRDPQVRAATTVAELLERRATATRRSVVRELDDAELADYLQPWHEPARARSWMAMAAAADARFTLDLVPALVAAAVPTRLVWGRDDEFQKIEFARRYVEQVPRSDLVEVAGKHIPMEDSPADVADAMLAHLEGGPTDRA